MGLSNDKGKTEQILAQPSSSSSSAVVPSPSNNPTQENIPAAQNVTPQGNKDAAQTAAQPVSGNCEVKPPKHAHHHHGHHHKHGYQHIHHHEHGHHHHHAQAHPHPHKSLPACEPPKPVEHHEEKVVKETQQSADKIPGGHTEKLLFLLVDEKSDVNSVPQKLGIPGVNYETESPYLPTLLHRETATEKPCCTVNNDKDTIFSIDANETSYSPNPIVIDGHTYVGFLPNIFNSIGPFSTFGEMVVAAFSFNFQYFCDGGYGQLVFTPHAAGVQALEAIEGNETDTISLASVTIPIIGPADPVEAAADCNFHPLSCSNPINEIEIDANVHFTSPTQTITVQEFAQLYDFDDVFDFVNGYLSSDLSFRYCDNYRSVYQLEIVNGKPELIFTCNVDTGDGPIVLDLNNKGFELTSVSDSQVVFDVNGHPTQLGWIGPDNGFLTYDYSGKGPIVSKNFILTENVPGTQTDLQALAALAGQSGGILDNSNPIFSKLGVWQDANQNGILDKGEYHTLTQLGIVSISLTESGGPVNLNGNTINGVLNFNYADGTVGKAADVTLKTADILQSEHSIPGLNSLGSAPNLVTSPSALLPHASETPHQLLVTQTIEHIAELQHVLQHHHG